MIMYFFCTHKLVKWYLLLLLNKSTIHNSDLNIINNRKYYLFTEVFYIGT